MKKIRTHLVKDVILIVVSIIAAMLFARLDLSSYLLHLVSNPWIASFVTGIFFTSMFTIAPASVVLVELTTHTSAMEVAAFGALGAVLGDVIMFLFIRDKLSSDLTALLKVGLHKSHLEHLHSRYARWIFPVVGALVIASPLPDEIGIMLLGFTKMKTRYMIPVSFVMNFIGVLLIVAASIALGAR
jgi:hypothetical protein